MKYDGYINVASDNITNDWLLLGSEDYNERCTIYDKNLNAIMETRAYPLILDGYASYFDGDAYICVDKDGKEIFCYVMTSLGED
jgi:hypothetical protein